MDNYQKNPAFTYKIDDVLKIDPCTKVSQDFDIDLAVYAMFLVRVKSIQYVA